MSKTFIKRPLCFILSLLMIVGLYPFSILNAGSAVPTPFSAMGETKTADPSTMNDWVKYFNDSTTEYAGGVWTDKSVFTDASAFTANGISMKAQEDFLVALSTMASNKSVIGQTTAPTDTMIVLDLSSSMYSAASGYASTVETMLNTVNDMIVKLQGLNEHNRVGVTIYFGHTTLGDAPANSYQLWLPLDRYTHSSNTFLKITKDGQDLKTAGVNTNVKNSAGTTVSNVTRTVPSVAGTYVQQGILSALKQFLAADTKVPSNASVQPGTDRIPVMVLMSDGKPTAATNYYNQLDKTGVIGSNREDIRSPAETDFLTQLTAAYAKEMMDAHYEASPLVYSLSLGNGISYDVMDPSNSLKLNNGAYTDEIKDYWNNLISAATSIDITGKVWDGGWTTPFKTESIKLNVAKTTISGKTLSSSKSFPASLAQQYYVDEAFIAENRNDLADTFADIFTSISLQSKIYPTLVEGDANLSGYVSFVDKLGKYMEVKDVKGLLINNVLHTGRSFAKHVIEHHSNGNIALDPNDICYSFIDSVEKRLGIDEGTALSLISLAIANGQLTYNATANTFSNYIGWFSDADGNYVGFWHEGIADIPAGATHINHSYGFFGDTDVSHHIDEHDMLYATVRVREEIATGFESVAFAVPAALIPTRTYNVSLDEHGNPTNVTVTGDTSPIRLVYEVGLEDEINEVTVKTIVNDAEYLAEHVKNGEYEFFTNRFDHGTDVTAYGTNNTYAYFTPSKENERYYYLSDSLIYSDTNGTVYKGAAPSPSGTYYRAVTVYQKNGTSYAKNIVYEQIMPYALSSSSHLVQKGENWYVKAGTAHNYVEGREVLKSKNNTSSVDYSYHPFVDGQNGYVVGAVLGNNGRLVLTPATGIQIGKTVEEVNTEAGAPTSFNFTVTNKTNATDGATYKSYHVTAGGVVTEGIITFSGGKASFSIKDGEKFYITGMTAGDVFTVTEAETAYYICKQNDIDLTVVDKSLARANFVNTARGKGNLTVAKEVAHDFGTSYEIPADKIFNFEVTLEGVGIIGSTFAAKHSGDATVTAVTIGADGKVTFSLKHNEEFEIYGLPEGTKATVVELNPGAGFTAAYTENFTAGDGIVTVEKNAITVVEVVNTYKPDPVTVGTQIVVSGPKTFLNADGTTVTDWKGLTFSAKLQKRVGDEWVDMQTVVATQSNSNFTFDFSGETYTEAGVYAYQVFEIADSTQNIFYDSVWHTFSVTVADTDMDGKLEIVGVHSDHSGKDFEKIDGVWTVPTGFTNSKELLVPATVAIKTQKALTNNSESPLVNLAGYTFGVYSDEACTTAYTADGIKIVKIDLAPTDSVGEGLADIIIGEEGTYTFYIKEIPGSVNNMTYDGKVVKVDVVATAVDGKITTKVTYSEALNSEGELVFTNVYTPTKATLALDVRKVLTGRDLVAGEFTFEIRETNGTKVAEGTNDASGKVTFDKELTFDKVGVFHYDVVETSADGNGVTTDKSPRRVTVTVEDKDGVLTASYVVESTAENYIIFNNTYTAKSVKHAIGGNKVLTGRELLNAEFKFTLAESDANGNIVAGGKSFTAENRLNGSFSFPEIEYTKVGDYYYVVTEVNDSAIPGIKYDTTKYIVKITVKDDLKGQLTVETPVIHIAGGGAADEIKFTNEYTPASISGDIAGNKIYQQEVAGTLTNKVFSAGQFSFSLYNSDKDWAIGSLIQRVDNKADGTFKFDTLTFTEPGTHYYIVNEYHGGTTVNGIVYDSTVYRIKAVITDNKEGKLVAAIYLYDENNTSKDAITFNNLYTFTSSDSVVISGTKVLENKALEANKFEFVLTDTTDSANHKVLESAFNKADGSFAFEAITYTEPGTYTYTVSEKNGGQTIDGITYDNTVYTVTVTVTDNGNGHLTATQEIKGATGIKFTNTYSTNNVTATIGGTKELVGRDLKDDEFTFILKDSDGNEIKKATNKNGKFTFEALTFDKVGTYTYTVSEEKGSLGGITYDAHSYTVTVTVTDDGKGQLVASVSGADAIKFTNHYVPTAVEAIIKGTKSYTTDVSGTVTDKDFGAGTFDFQLFEADSAWNVAAGAKPYKTTSNAADKSFTFDKLSFTAAGTYYYVVKEVHGGQTINGTTFDGTEYRVKIVVSDDLNGTLSTAVTYYKGNTEVTQVAFANTYTATNPHHIQFSGTKVLTGYTGPTKEFEFVLYNAKLEGGVYVVDGAPIDTVKSATGSFFFKEIDIQNAGTHYYIVKEVLPANYKKGDVIDGITYDTTEYLITVVVTDDGNGNLTADVSGDEGILFTNTYTAKEVTATISGTKKLTGRDLKDGEFTFILKDSNGNEIRKATNKGVKFEFEELTFDKAGTYTYTVTEEKGSLGGITYDTKSYTVIVTVTDNYKGQLVAAQTIENANSIEFTNTYKANEVTATIGGTKELTGRDLKDGEFTFILKDSNGNEIKKATNKGGKFEFEALTFDKVGTYTYTVTEEKGSLGGITYDAKSYTVTVTVTDDGNGQLVAAQKIDGADSIKFTNTYKASQSEIVFSGKKELIGRDIGDGEFKFILKDENGNEIETVSNTGKTFSFKAIHFDKVGTYTYTISEVNTNLGGVTYDTTVYTVVVTVTDDTATGKLVAKSSISENGFVFTNTYTTESVKVNIKADKALTGKTLAGGDFSFVIAEVGGSYTETVKNAADGSISFSELTFDKVGTYTYTVSEVIGFAGGIKYDETKYTVTITVTDNGDGKLIADVKGADGILFKNSYNTENTEVRFSGTKQLLGRPIVAGEFEFILKGSGVDQTVKVNADGSFAFDAISYDKTGTYTYIVYEIKGSLAGVTYDEKVYDITVEVTDDGNGKLVTKVTGADSITFTNKYKATAAEIIFSGNKQLTGRPLKAGEFSFTLVDTKTNAIIETVTNDANGNFVFHTIKYDTQGEYNYTISEVKGNLGGVTYDSKVYTVKVVVTDDGNGKLVAKIENPTPVVFNNTYSTEKTSVQISGNKVLTGRNLTAGEFSFTIIGNGINETVSNDASGSFKFSAIEYTAAGTYTYSVSEVKGTLPGIKYDETIYTVTVTVTDDGNGKLVAEVSGADKIIFNNAYNAESTTVRFNGTKKLTGRDIIAGEFEFILKGAGVEQTVKADANGNFSFDTITYTKVGTYKYTVEEIDGKLPGVTYDNSTINITVEVTDEGNGKLVAKVTGADSIVFNNSYDAEGTEIYISGTKKLIGRDLNAGEFEFILEGEGVSQTTKVKADGSFTFNAIPYDEVGTHKYTVKEVKGNLPGVTYDETVHEVTVEVTDDGKGNLVAEVTSAKAIVFENTYSASAYGSEIVGIKILAGRDLRANEFQFVLKDSNGKIIQTVSNDADGKFTFSKINYSSAGVYEYTISEVNNKIKGITYDTSVYNITVVATDNGDGTLSTTISGADNLIFTNSYRASNISITLSGTKALIGRDLKDKEFTFLLKNINGVVIDTATNNANGEFSFDAIKFNSRGTFTFYVCEQIGSEIGMNYDTTEYRVIITITDSGSGYLSAEVRGAHSITFTNVFATPTYATFTGTKILEGKDLTEGAYSFELKDSAGNVIETVKNAADGTINFSAIEYTKAGTYNYTVSEVPGNDASVLYDATVYPITVTVTDNGSGKLVADVQSNSIVFTNRALTPATVTFEGRKYLDLVLAGGFNFVLKEGDNVIANATSDENGYFNFGTLVYDREGTYTYTISEVAGNDENIIYDTNVFTVTVTVTLEGTEFKANAKVDLPNAATGIAFYNHTIPEETTEVPEETTTVPEETTTIPEETTVTPEETTAVPEETTTAPEETTVTPEETTKVPEETTDDPEDTETPNPPTGDGSTVIVWFGAIIIAFCATAGALFSKKRSTDNE